MHRYRALCGMHTLRSIRLLIALSEATVGLAACGGSDGPSSAGDTAVNDVFDAFCQIDTAMATMFIVDRDRIGLPCPEYAAIINTEDHLCGFRRPS